MLSFAYFFEEKNIIGQFTLLLVLLALYRGLVFFLFWKNPLSTSTFGVLSFVFVRAPFVILINIQMIKQYR